jgi:hypothetical protein
MPMTNRPITREQLLGTLDAFRTRLARSRSGLSGSQRGVTRSGTPADVTSVRAKSSRHGKSTADKWNQ